MSLEILLPYIWVTLIAVGIIVYVLLDGFDLGVGILFPMLAEDVQKDIAINSVAPFWDGNETWLILGVGGLYVAFPLAYATLMPALYMPVFLMLLGLIFRGVAFEFRFKANTSRQVWDLAFHFGSTMAAFCQGMMIGAFLQGFEVVNNRFVGTGADWFSPICVFTGLALVIAYALLGSCWLNMKTSGELQLVARRYAKRLMYLFFISILILSIWSPLLHSYIADRWFSSPNIYFTWLVPALTLALMVMLHNTIAKGYEFWPFFLTLGLFVVSYVGLLVSVFPTMVPPDITFIDAAAPASSQLFVLIGVVVLLPIILGYTGYIYWVFRGKVSAGQGYHH